MADPSQVGLVSLRNTNDEDFRDANEEQNLGAKIIQSENLELKPEEPYKTVTEEKNKKNQASNSLKRT